MAAKVFYNGFQLIIATNERACVRHNVLRELRNILTSTTRSEKGVWSNDFRDLISRYVCQRSAVHQVFDLAQGCFERGVVHNFGANDQGKGGFNKSNQPFPRTTSPRGVCGDKMPADGILLEESLYSVMLYFYLMSKKKLDKGEVSCIV